MGPIRTWWESCFESDNKWETEGWGTFHKYSAALLTVASHRPENPDNPETNPEIPETKGFKRIAALQILSYRKDVHLLNRECSGISGMIGVVGKVAALMGRKLYMGPIRTWHGDHFLND